MRRSPRSLVAGALVILAVLGFLIYQGLSNNLVYYQTPSELLAHDPYGAQSVRLGGQVRPGSVHWSAMTRVLRFVVQDPKAHVAVVSHGLPPELFRPGIGVVVEGSYRGGVFSATNLMIKHSSDYVAPKPGQTPVPDTFVSQASP